MLHNETSSGFATNLLAGLVVVLFIDTLSRLAEEHRRKPVLFATLRVNSVACARLYHLLSKASEHAAAYLGDGTVTRMMSPNDPIDRSFAEYAQKIPTQHQLSGRTFLRDLDEDARSVRQSVEKALERYGLYQEPSIALALARLDDAMLLSIPMQLQAYNAQTNVKLPHEAWIVAIEAHNTLRGYIDRTSARLGYDPRRSL
jgi:hypothetical protein